MVGGYGSTPVEDRELVANGTATVKVEKWRGRGGKSIHINMRNYCNVIKKHRHPYNAYIHVYVDANALSTYIYMY